MSDIIAGRVQLGFEQVSVSLPNIKQGKVIALAVTTDKRVASLPDVPTFEMYTEVLQDGMLELIKRGKMAAASATASTRALSE